MDTVGRDDELRAVATFLETASMGGVLTLSGEPGIGKTTVWRAGVELAADRGHRILIASPSAAEAGLAFTTLRDVLDPWFDEIADKLPDPQR
jgi:ABC-type dipeptide/oligopeptide/nickel transport system ATPase subunit